MMYNRRQFLKKTGVFAIAGGVMPVAKVWGAKSRSVSRPNIIYLMSDDQRWDTMGCYGHPEFKTKNLDALAADGVLFENCYYAVSICMPSRATVLTGKYMSTHRCGFDRPTNYTISRAEFSLTYPAILKKAGYRTGFIGKVGFAITEKKTLRKKRGEKSVKLASEYFDYWQGWPDQAPKGGYWPPNYGLKSSYQKDSRPHLTDIVGDLIGDFIDTNNADKPFCLSVSFHAPKGALKPADAKPEYNKIFDGVTFQKPENYVPGLNEKLPDVIKRNWRGLFPYHKRYTWTPELYQKFVRRQAALTYGIDVQVGKLMAKLRDKGLLDNTVIIFTSDNGFFNGSHGLDGKALLYEESMRAPLIVWDPRLDGSKRGQRLPQLVSTVDYAPTIIDLAGANIPDAMQGMSLKPLIQGQKHPKWRDAVFMENNFTQNKIVPIEEAKNNPEALAKTNTDSLRCHGIRTEQYKYIRFFELDPVFEELYDLKSDPLEQKNLATDPKHTKVLQELRRKCSDLKRYASGKK